MLEKETQKHIRLENLLRMLSESSFIESVFSIWSPGFLLSSPSFLNASPSTSPGFSRVRVFPESGFSSGPSPSPSPVRVSKYALCEHILSKYTVQFLMNMDQYI